MTTKDLNYNPPVFCPLLTMCIVLMRHLFGTTSRNRIGDKKLFIKKGVYRM